MISTLKIKVLVSSLLIFFIFKSSYGQDWANLNMFQKKNSEISTPKTGEDRIVFMGNSITIGWLNIRPEFFQNKPYINRGISGQTTPQMLLRFRQDVIDLQPSTVVILAGVNDIAGNTGPSTIEMIANNIFSMAELAKINNIKVVLCSVLPAIDFPWKPGVNPANKVIELNSLIKSYANKHNIVYADYFSAMANNSNGLRAELGKDGIHPNTVGYLIMEPILEEALKRTLLKK